MEKYTDIFSGKNTILHFAPEKHIREKIKKNSLADYYDADIRTVRSSNIIDITNIPYEDNKFDYIICNQVLEHIIKEKEAINELKRVVKPNGKIILTVPICISNEHTIEDDTVTDSKQRIALFCQDNHVRLYGKDFKKRLENYGLIVEEYNIDEREGIEERNKYGITPHGLVYIASKKM